MAHRTVTIRLDDETARGIEELRTSTGLSTSDVMRDAIRRSVEAARPAAGTSAKVGAELMVEILRKRAPASGRRPTKDVRTIDVRAVIVNAERRKQARQRARRR